MTRPARHHLAAAKIVSVDFGDHVHHVACHSFSRSIRSPIYLIGAGANMAVRAIELKGRRHESHRLQEIVYRDSLQRLNIFEDLLRHERFVLLRGPGRP
jgi:hypothetical protein